MFSKRILLAALAAALLAPCASAGKLDSQLEKISAQFAKDAAAKLPDLNPVTAAVFQFQADDALAKRKVDVAVSELLTQKLYREPKFRLVERSRLDEVLKEQKLGLSGALESETAAQVGKLAGARLAAMGSVSKMGRNYQISAKLVDTESGDVVSVSIVEVPASVFDEEASRYLVLVPETQTISIYLVGGGINVKTKNLPARTVSGTTLVPANVKTKGFDPDSGFFAGFGIKYFPYSRWALDLAYVPFFKLGDPKKSVVTNVPPGMLAAKAEGKMFRFLLHRQFRPLRKVNLYAGGGFARFELDPPSENQNEYTKDVALTSGGTSMHMANGFGEGRFMLPLASLGLEYKPQARFGLSALATMPLASKTYTWEANPGTSQEKVRVWEMTTPKYMLEANLSWYF